MNTTRTNLAAVLIRVSAEEGARRRMRASGRSFAHELDEQCTGTGVCQPDFTFTPTVGSVRTYKDPPRDWQAIVLLLAVCAGVLGSFLGLLGLGLWKFFEIVAW